MTLHPNRESRLHGAAALYGIAINLTSEQLPPRMPDQDPICFYRGSSQAPNPVLKVLTKVNPRWLDCRLVIALHSPNASLETGLRMYPPEKSPDSDPLRCRAVRSLQSGLCANNREIRACFAYFGVKGGGLSLQLRLAGGARSLELTLLHPNSLLTGKNTGDLRDFALENALIFLCVKGFHDLCKVRQAARETIFPYIRRRR